MNHNAGRAEVPVLQLTFGTLPLMTAPRPAVVWIGDADAGHLQLIDQTLLPVEYRELALRTVEEVWEAIKLLRVRGAPAIGVAAAYGVIVGCQTARVASRDEFDARLKHVVQYLAESRPTAVNLFWADRKSVV